MHELKVPQRSRKPNSVPAVRRLAARSARRDDHSSSPAITGGIKQPTRRLRTGRPIGASACHGQRLPIWSCSVRGFACHLCCHRRGALLPHLFTLTSPVAACSTDCGEAARQAVYFLCHFPSGCPDRALPGALPCGVRTFLPPSPCGSTRRSSGLLRRAIPVLDVDCRTPTVHEFACSTASLLYPSVSCVIWYCSSFLYRLLRGVSITSAVFEMFQPFSRSFRPGTRARRSSLNSRSVPRLRGARVASRLRRLGDRRDAASEAHDVAAGRRRRWCRRRHDDQPLDRVAQLADVALPA